MMKRCPLCCHIYRPEEPHTCPTPEYVAHRDALVADAAQEAEDNWWNGVDVNGEPIHLEQ